MNVLKGIGNWFTESAGPVILEWLKTAGVSIVTGIIILFVGLWASKIIARVIAKTLRKTKADEGISGFIVSCSKFVLKLVVIIAAIAAVGVNISSIITALGAAGITIGLAMQDSLSNFASGVLILYNKPFVIGDFVEIDGSTGTVKAIELMHTVLNTAENKELIFPNSRITANKIINYNRLSSRRLDLSVPVAYGSDVAQVKDCLMEICMNSPHRLPDKAEPVIGLREFAGSSINFDIKMWISADDYWDAYYSIQEKIYDEFALRGISIPFDQVDVHIKNS